MIWMDVQKTQEISVLNEIYLNRNTTFVSFFMMGISFIWPFFLHEMISSIFFYSCTWKLLCLCWSIQIPIKNFCQTSIPLIHFSILSYLSLSYNISKHKYVCACFVILVKQVCFLCLAPMLCQSPKGLSAPFVIDKSFQPVFCFLLSIHLSHSVLFGLFEEISIPEYLFTFHTY